jgi:p-aminobenzoyl-glutamate transporter AbgT
MLVAEKNGALSALMRKILVIANARLKELVVSV